MRIKCFKVKHFRPERTVFHVFIHPIWIFLVDITHRLIELFVILPRSTRIFRDRGIFNSPLNSCLVCTFCKLVLKLPLVWHDFIHLSKVLSNLLDRRRRLLNLMIISRVGRHQVIARLHLSSCLHLLRVFEDMIFPIVPISICVWPSCRICVFLWVDRVAHSLLSRLCHLA